MPRTGPITLDGHRYVATVDDVSGRMEIHRDGAVASTGTWDGDSFDGGGVPAELPTMLMATLDGWRPTHRIVVSAPRAAEVIVCLDDDLAYTAGEWIEGTWPQWSCEEGRWTHTPQGDDAPEGASAADFRVEALPLDDD